MSKKKQILIAIVILLAVGAVSAVIIFSFNNKKKPETNNSKPDDKTQEVTDQKPEETPTEEPIEEDTIAVKEELELKLASKVPTIKDFIEDENLTGTIEITKEGKEITDTLKEVGDYQVKIVINEKEYTAVIHVSDTVKPVLKLKDLTINEGDKYELKQFVSSCTDNSGKDCALSYAKSEMGKYTKAGTYTIEITAKDESNNETSAKIKLTIKKKTTSSNSSQSSNQTTSNSNNNSSTNNTNNQTSSKPSTSSGTTNNTGTTSKPSSNTGSTSKPSANNSNSNTSSNNNNTPSSNNTTSNPSTNSGSSNNNSTTETKPVVTKVKTDSEKVLVSSTEKYGVKTNTYKTTTYDYYSDGSKKEKSSSTNTELDFSGYHATTAELLPEAKKLANDYSSQVKEMLKYVNEYRAEVGAEPLTLDSELTKAAMARALELAYANKFSHTRPNGTTCFTILSELSYSYRTVGENIAAGNSTSKATAVQWRNSPGHYANMINKDFTKLGVGLVKLPGSKYTYYWVQLFAA
ncbi:MAG: CAP domain-containing protein [Bacilli bacterium]|nr:CAP domain-containing protein [Bacilli bacterium]